MTPSDRRGAADGERASRVGKSGGAAETDAAATSAAVADRAKATLPIGCRMEPEPFREDDKVNNRL